MSRQVRNPLKSLAAAVYGVYAWLAFLTCILTSLVVAVVVPGLERRRSWSGASARWAFVMAGVKCTVRGLDNLPAGHCIVVANHASYADGVILHGFLPPRFGYVIKGEMQNIPIAHFLLRRLGSRFVERNSASGSARDARSLLKAAADGESLAFFPEGTFLEHKGLERFRPGAFAAAIKAGLPVVPVVIRGSRKLLPAGAAMPRHSRIDIDILGPISESDPAFRSSTELAELARQRILTVLDEPDLLAENAA